MTVRFASITASTAIALAIGAGTLFTAATAHAQVVSSGVVNLPIPRSPNGLYLNVVTGAHNLLGTGGTYVPGWDINLWSNVGLGFFTPSNPMPGAYVVTAPGFVANLAPGTLVAGISTFGSGAFGNVAQWSLNSANNFFGFRFINEEAGGTPHYGWGQIAIGASISDRTLVQYAYDSRPGAPITVVPEPGTYALMGLGLAGLLAARRRFGKAD